MSLLFNQSRLTLQQVSAIVGMVDDINEAVEILQNELIRVPLIIRSSRQCVMKKSVPEARWTSYHSFSAECRVQRLEEFNW